MLIDYLADFPIPEDFVPPRLRALLEPVSIAPREFVEVTARYDFDQYGPAREHVHMIMAVVPERDVQTIRSLDGDGHGVVSYSVPFSDEKGSAENFKPSISGYDYVVASWGNGSFYSFALAEKVWMALGLTPRCVGNDSQRVIYDDLSLPEFGIAEGEISTEFYWESKRDISWKMSNEYLRKYLWVRNAFGVRVFYYQTLLPDCPAIRKLMGREQHIQIKPINGWYEVDIREHQGGLLLQLWASVVAVPPELCPEQTADHIIWPGIGEMTERRARGLVHYGPETTVYLDDRFLQRYEQSGFYNSVPVKVQGGRWLCSPAYKGQWSFTDCFRVGRNLIRVPIRELYKAKPDREILHAHQYAVDPAIVAGTDLEEEHIPSKVDRLVFQMLSLGENLSALAKALGIERTAEALSGFSRDRMRDDGWADYPQLARLAQVASLDMSQQAFLSRCKNLHEIWQRIPDGFLRNLLEKSGCPREKLKDFKSLRLLQALLNVVAELNKQEEDLDNFCSDEAPDGWNSKNADMAGLFLNNELRKADAHENMEGCLRHLEELGFDIADVNQGYGRALDFVFDKVISSFMIINRELVKLLVR